MIEQYKKIEECYYFLQIKGTVPEKTTKWSKWILLFQHIRFMLLQVVGKSKKLENLKLESAEQNW